MSFGANTPDTSNKPDKPNKVVPINFDQLRGYNPDPTLYDDVAASYGPATGVVQLPYAEWLHFSDAIRSRLVNFLRGQVPQKFEEERARQQANWGSHDLKTCACGLCVSERNRQQVEHDRQQAEAQKPGQLRLRAYWRGEVAGYSRLLDNEHNNRVFDPWINDPSRDHISVLQPEHIDQFIQDNKDRLLWTLPDGSEQLPLDASDSRMLAASISQLKDLSRRKGEGKSYFNRVGRSAGNITTDSSVRSRKGGQSQVK